MKTEVVRVKTKHGFIASHFNNAEAVKEMSDKGYRYVGFIPATVEGYGRISEIDLIFERKEENDQ